MFEQSLLTHAASEKRAGAMAASLTVEVMAISALAIIPMLYTERLIFNPPTMPLFLSTRLSRPEIPVTVHTERRRASTGVFIPFASIRAGNTMITATQTVEGPDDSLIGGDLAPGPGLDFGRLPTFPVALPPPLPTQNAITPHVDPVPTAPVRVSTDLQAAKLLRKVVPVYPQIARMTRVQGIVSLTGIIAKDGSVAQLNVTSGHPLLVKAALDAVRQWTYQPTVLNGHAVEVVTTILVNFTLGQQ